MPRDREADEREWRRIRQRGEQDLINHHGMTRREAEKVQREAIKLSIENEKRQGNG